MRLISFLPRKYSPKANDYPDIMLPQHGFKTVPSVGSYFDASTRGLHITRNVYSGGLVSLWVFRLVR